MSKETGKSKNRLSVKQIIILAILIVFGVMVIFFGSGISSRFSTDGKITKLTFEDIGELATQSVTCTTVRVENKDRNLFGVTIPFTQSKIIYSYDTTIKAGFDFKEVKWHIGDTEETKNKIYIELPPAKVLSREVLYDSFKLYHENESIFAPVYLEEHNESMKELEEVAEKTAIENGLLDNAVENAKVLLRAFTYQVYNQDEYEIIFSE